MISVAQATEAIHQHALPLTVETVPLAQATGRVLATPLLADRPFPPFDRVTMDGIAIAHNSFAAGTRRFAIQGTQLAGMPAQTLESPATHCLEVMTGAVLPQGADTVIRYEDIQQAEGHATLTVEAINQGQNVHRLGSDRPEGSLLVPAGTTLSGEIVALAATVGAAEVSVYARPRVAVISTGDELVPVATTPLPHQIRRSNGPALAAALTAMGLECTQQHLPDDREAMAQALPALLKSHHVLIFSGGVSMGKADYVPELLREAGVQEHFHRVAQRPGKPLWFGTQPNGATVFGLPGNPVSTFMTFVRYARPYLQQAMGLPQQPTTFARLTEEFTFGKPLGMFLQASIQSSPTDGALLATPAPGGGSGDLANLASAQGFLELPAEKNEFKAGEAYPFWAY